MKTTPRRDSFAAMTDDRYSDTVCPACGYGIRRDEATKRDHDEKICHADCAEEENMEHNIPADTVTAELIVVTQLPVIEERLQSMKADVDALVLEGLSMVCTGETIQSVKAKRSEIRKKCSQIKYSLKDAEEYILKPFRSIEQYCKEQLLSPLQDADEKLKVSISEFEDGIIKRQCEEGLRDYFAELCAVHHLDWLTYERAGIKVDMASAKAKTPSKLRKQLMEFVVGVADSVDRISALEDASEIMAEYKRTLNAADAICTVQERHSCIEDQKKELETRRAVREQEDAMVHRVEALAPPVVVETQETVEVQETVKIRYMDFRAHGTMEQLSALKRFALENNIKLEAIKNEQHSEHCCNCGV